LPALRQRREDLPLLVRTFLADLCASTGKRVDGISDEGMALLLEYDWPGNVRELRNALEYAVIQARSSLLHSGDLPPELLESIPLTDMESSDLDDADVADEDRLRAALRHARGNRTRAAALLGISRATLYRRLKELDLDDA
jgi:DNA-binding NtrC family response regulator